MQRSLSVPAVVVLLAAAAWPGGCGGDGEETNATNTTSGQGGVGQGGSGGSPPGCGDAVCAPDETCANCEADCGSCACGDGDCDANELCSTCPDDCGACTGDPIVVTRGPYLQRGSSDSVVVRWRTAMPRESVVAWGPSTIALTQVATTMGPTTEHEVSVTGMQPDTKYNYAFGAPDADLVGGDDEHYVVTAPVTGTNKATRFWAIGDAGTADQNQANVRDAYLAYTAARGTDLWLMLGDNAYNSGTDNEYQAAVFDVYPSILNKSVVWATLGNHDGASADSGAQSGPYYDIFTLPTQGEAGGVPSGTEAYYSFDYGQIHFVCLDSYDSDTNPNGDMMTWLQSDLSANALPWLVAFWHHPPYSKGSHDSDSEGGLIDMRQDALPILEAHGVDLVLGGHSHAYERSMYLNGHYGNSGTLDNTMIIDGGDGRASGDGAYTRTMSSVQGAVYVVAGSSGKTSGGSLNHAAMFLSLNELGSVVVDVDGNTMDVSFIDDGGVEQDWFSIVKM